MGFSIFKRDIAQIIEGSIAPESTTGFWIDNSSGTSVLKYWDTTTNTWQSSGSGGSGSGTLADQVNDNTINIIKQGFETSAYQNANKYSMKNTTIDNYNDTSGIDTSKSTGYQWDSTNKLVMCSQGANVSQGITGYTFSTAPYSSYTDNNPTSKLTDGTLGTTNYSGDGKWVAWDETVGTIDTITINVNSAQTISKLNVHSITNTGSSMYYPSNIELLGSNDNATWTSLKTYATNATNSSTATTNMFTVTVNATTAYQYYQVKLTHGGSTGSTFLFVSEIQLFNSPSTTATVVSTADTASAAPTQVILDADYTLGTGTATFEISIDGGTTFTTVTPDTLTTITSTSGTSVVSKYTITNDTKVNSIGYSWT